MTRTFRYLMLLPLALALAIGLLLPKDAPAAKKPPGKPRQDDASAFTRDVEPLLSKYCYDCHDEDVQKGDLNLARFEHPEMILSERVLWEDVMRNVSMHVMPPLKKPQPSIREREIISDWIDGLLYKIDPNNPDPGRVTLRRLNRTEYNNTVRDLLHVDFSPADDFPADDTGYGFDNNGDVLTLSSLLMEKYLAAAEQVVASIFDDPTPKRQKLRVDLSRFRSEKARVTDSSISFHTNGEAAKQHKFPHRGDYLMHVKAWATQAGEETAKMSVLTPDGKEKVLEVRAARNKPGVYTIPFSMSKEKGRIAVEFINDFWDPKHPRKDRRDRNLTVTALMIEGPVNEPEKASNVAKDKLYALLPGGKIGNERESARNLLKQIGSRAYRRPASSREVMDLMRLYEMRREDGGSFEDGLRMALTAILVSPHFLFRGATHPDPDNKDAVHPVSEHALASRLSYFLWSSMPDHELMELASRNQLRKNLLPQIRRMLKDPKSRALTDNFAGQWLQFRDMEILSPDPSIFRGFSDQLRRAMKEETRLCFEYIIRDNRSILELLESDYSFLNEPLARHYGIDGIKGMHMRKVSPLKNGRGGVLRHASILTLTSHPDRTSPVLRGKWVLENILGTPPPPAPDDVPALEANDKIKEGMSFREQLALHASEPVCASCHSIMDPIGLAFEHYDAIGKWRAKDGEATIDPSGSLNTGESFKNADELIAILSEQKTDQFVRCMAERMLTYALGRGVEYYDRPAIDKIVSYVKKYDYRAEAMIVGVIYSIPFQKQRGEEFQP